MTNLAAFALLFAVWVRGWLDPVFLYDSTRLTMVISAIFLLGLGISIDRAWRLSRELDAIHAGRPRTGSWAARYLDASLSGGAGGWSAGVEALKLKLGVQIGSVRHISNMLVFFGLIGTVIGFIIALKGVDPESARDPEQIAPMVSTLIDGMGVALYTTLVGSVLYVWLNLNYRILASGSAHLAAAVIELGERGRVSDGPPLGSA